MHADCLSRVLPGMIAVRMPPRQTLPAQRRPGRFMRLRAEGKRWGFLTRNGHCAWVPPFGHNRRMKIGWFLSKWGTLKVSPGCHRSIKVSAI